MTSTSNVAPADRESAGLFLLDQTMSYVYPAALRAVALLGVADLLVDGPKTPQELARLTETDPQKLYRVLRVLATRGVFREDDQGRFELTTAADLLRKDVPLSVRNAIIMITSKALWLPVGELAESVRGENPSFERIFGKQIWDYWSQDLAPEEDFHVGMSSMSEPEIQSPVRSYEFPEKATVVDVGGGYGGGLLLVLRNCRDAMTPGGRVLVFDAVIPPGNDPHTGKLNDLLVMSIYPGRERTEEDFRQLFADAGLRLNRVIDTDSYIFDHRRCRSLMRHRERAASCSIHLRDAS